MIYRKKSETKRAEPMPKKQFRRICKALKRQGVTVWMGEIADQICNSQGAEAFALNENTVVFRKNPSRSVVFEELIHLWQFATNRCDGTKISRIRCEIEAKEKVLRCAKSYELTKLDIEITKKALQLDYIDFQQYYEGGDRYDHTGCN